MILMIYTSFSTFVKADYDILSTKYEIKRFQYSNTKSILSHIVNQMRVIFWLSKYIVKCKTIYIWFADYHSFFPILFSKLFNKKSFIVLGGYDVTYLPEYNYGSFNNPIRAFCARYAINNAQLNLAVADNIKDDALNYAPKAKVEILYTGYSDTRFTLGNKKDNEVMSVCEATTLQRAFIKGCDLIFQTAQKAQDIKFNIVALDEKLARDNFEVPENINFIKHLSQEQLIEQFKRNSVYLQLSLREGLPNSVCEAMLCGCIPVGTNSGGIPLAIGDTGYIAQNRDPKEIAELIKSALLSNDENRTAARTRIKENFSWELREQRLLNIIEQ